MGIEFVRVGLAMAGYFGVLLLIIEIMRSYHRLAAWFWVASLATFPLWLMGGVQGWFRWAKILSVILPTIVVGLSRLAVHDEQKGQPWRFLRSEGMLWFFYSILFLNIMEATVKDFAMGNVFNALCGFLLCVTIPFPPRFWRIATGKTVDLIAYTTAPWNAIYTLWNACFVYAEGSLFFASSVCILLAAELYPLLKRRPELYITARIYTLAAHLVIRACFPALFPLLMDSSSWFHPEVMRIWGMANCGLMIFYVFWHNWQLHTGNAEQTFRRSVPVPQTTDPRPSEA